METRYFRYSYKQLSEKMSFGFKKNKEHGEISKNHELTILRYYRKKYIKVFFIGFVGATEDVFMHF